MATTTTLTSLSSSKPETKELCIICELQPYDLICTCGDKFDFNCIHQHVEQIGVEFQEQYQQASEKLARINDLRAKEHNDSGATRTLIDTWKRKRIQDINDIADKATHDRARQESIFNDIPSYQETYNQISAELHRIVHDNLNILIKLNQQINDKIENCQNVTIVNINEGELDASLQSKLNPSTSEINEATTTSSSSSTANTAAASSSPSFNMTNHNSMTVETEPEPRRTEVTREVREPEPRRTEVTREVRESEPRRTEDTREVREPEPGPSMDLPNSNDTNNDEFDAGYTGHIQRINPIIIPAGNDKFAATVCCHNNQLFYNLHDRTTQQFQLVFIRDIMNSTVTETIVWNQSDTNSNANDDDWIQDIVYSDKLSSYLLLNRARIRRFNDVTNELNKFHTFTDRTMKRLACSDKFIYLTSAHGTAPYNGDEIILMNYAKEEQLTKTFRDIIPSRLNRGAGPLVGEISDLAVGTNEQITIGYRLERRHEVGVCLFNVTNDGREWSCAKQLLLNECWHNNLSYTPRLDWCEQLNVFILIEFMTGHLIMISRDGQVEGECRFMQVDNRRESPVNLTISTNNWFCVRYESSITIHKITS